MFVVFQFSYTTLFGIYSAFIFVRTGELGGFNQLEVKLKMLTHILFNHIVGHLIGPFICHSFCNYMGIPEFDQIPYTKYPKGAWNSDW